jgi:hypothetical protein
MLLEYVEMNNNGAGVIIELRTRYTTQIKVS